MTARLSLSRAALTVLAVLSILLGAAGAVRAAEPTPLPDTMGASVSAIVIADESPSLHVTNRGSVETTFTATVPDGWGITPASITLTPGQEGVLTLTGRGDAGLATVYGAQTHPRTGDATAIRFGAIRVMQTRPFDPMRYLPTVLYALLALGVVLLVLRRVRPWQYRLTRA